MEAIRQAAEQGDAGKVDRKRKKDKQAVAEEAFIEPDDDEYGADYQPGQESGDEQEAGPAGEDDDDEEVGDSASAAARLAGTGTVKASCRTLSVQKSSDMHQGKLAKSAEAQRQANCGIATFFPPFKSLTHVPTDLQ